MINFWKFSNKQLKMKFIQAQQWHGMTCHFQRALTSQLILDVDWMMSAYFNTLEESLKNSRLNIIFNISIKFYDSEVWKRRFKLKQ